MYIVSHSYRRRPICLPGCGGGVQTSARLGGLTLPEFSAITSTVANAAGTVISASKGGTSAKASGGGSSSQESLPPTGGNFLDRLSSTELAIGSVAGLGLILALVR